MPRCSAFRSGALFSSCSAVQGAVGFFGYEMIHRIQAVLTVVLFVTFVVFAVKLAAGHQIVTPATVQGADLVGAFVLEVTIALSLSISWASYAADFSRYLPADSSRARVFGFTFAGIVLAYIFVQGIGIAAGDLVSEHTADGVRSVMGGGILGALALLVIALASIGSGVMNDYSGSLALQTIGVRVRRPISAVVVTVAAFALILWLHAGETASRFEHVLLLVSYWIPAFVAVVVIDWALRVARTGDHQPRRGAHRPRRRRRGGGRVRARLRRRGAVHEHLAVHRSGRRGMARRRRRLLRQFPCRSGSLRRLSAVALPSRELGQVQPGGLIATPFIQPDGVGVACKRAEDQVVDADARADALSSRSRSSEPSPLPRYVGQHTERLDFADPVAGLPGVLDPRVRNGHHVGQAVSDRLVVDEGQQKQGVRFGQQLLVELPAGAPRLGVVHVRRKLGHALAVAVMHSDPERSDEVQIVDATYPHPPRSCHPVTLAQPRATPSAIAWSLSGLATLWIVTMRPSASRSTVSVAMTRPSPLSTTPGAPLISTTSADMSPISTPS